MMGLLRLEYPRLSVSLDVPDRLAGDFGRNFSFAVAPGHAHEVDERYRVRFVGPGVLLFKGEALLGTFPDPLELMFALEEDIENSLLARIDDWVGLHAGAAVLRDAAIVVVGRPDTGKTTTTFQLVELGLDLLCEEVAAVDPETREVQPFPQVLTLARHYAEQFCSRYAVTGGTLGFPSPTVARYAAARIRKEPVPLGVVLFPAFDPSCQPMLEEVTPGEVLTDLLQHCFPPARGDERLYDDVIRLIDRCRLFRLRTCSIESARALLLELIGRLP